MTDDKNASDRRAFHPQLGNAMIFAPLRDGKTVPASTYEAMKLTSAELARITGKDAA